MALKKYKVVSLFSGAMGLDIGLEQTGRFKVVAAVELESAFCETIRANKRAGHLNRDLKVFEGDISNIRPEDVLAAAKLEPGEVDLLVGGPPCQSFSTAGKRGTVQDPRGTLLWQFLKYVDVMQPRFFLMENVRGLLSAALKHRPIADRPNKGGAPLSSEEEPGSVVRLFANDLQNVSGGSYHMDIFEVNAVNYGAPQLRERALFIGNRFGHVIDFPDPTHGPDNKEDISKQDDLFEMSEENVKQPWETLGSAIGDLEFDDADIVMDFSPRKKSFLKHVPPGSNWRSLPIEMQQESMGKAWHAKGGRSGWWRRLNMDLPSPTLVTMPNHASTALCHPFELRALSLREYARVQEFPDDWSFCGTPAEQYAQVGNAVPVRLGEVAGEVIAPELDRLRKAGWPVSITKPDAYRVVYVQSHVRTRRWYQKGKTVVWNDGNKNEEAAYTAPQTIRRQSTL